MYLNMAIIAESLSPSIVSSAANEAIETSLTGACPLDSFCGDGPEELVFVAAENDALIAESLPHHLVVVCPANSTTEHLESICSSMTGDEREVACIASEDGVPEILLKIASVFSRLQTWDDRLVSAIMRGADMQEILSIGAEELTNPVALFDSASVLVAHAGALPDGWQRSIWGDVIERGFVPMEHYSAEELRTFRRRTGESRNPIVATPSKGHGEIELTCTIEVDGNLFAMLAQVDLNSPFSAAQRTLVSHVRDRMETMYRTQAQARGRRDELAHILRMALVGRPQDSSVMRFHLRSRGWSQDDAIRIVRIPLTADMIETGRDQAQLSRVCITFPKAVALVHDETLVLACRTKDYHGDVFDKELDKLAREMGATIAVSDTFPGISNASTAYRQCILVHEIARVRSLSGVISFPDSAIPALTEAIKAQDMAEEFIDSRVAILAQEPQGRELVGNLRTYLLCGCNTAKAAKRLYMHRNTLDYRVARIERIIGVSPADLTEDETLRMILSCSLVSCRD